MHRVADALEEEEQEEARDSAITRTERRAKAARDASNTVHAQQERGVDEAQERSAYEAPAGERELAKGEHEARVRVADAHALVHKVVHCEGGDAHLRAAAHTRRLRQMISATQRGYEHIAGLRDKTEDAAVLFVEGPHVCRCLASPRQQARA